MLQSRSAPLSGTATPSKSQGLGRDHRQTFTDTLNSAAAMLMARSVSFYSSFLLSTPSTIITTTSSHILIHPLDTSLIHPLTCILHHLPHLSFPYRLPSHPPMALPPITPVPTHPKPDIQVLDTWVYPVSFPTVTRPINLAPTHPNMDTRVDPVLIEKALRMHSIVRLPGSVFILL